MKNILYIALMTFFVSCGTQKIIAYEYNIVTRGYKQNIKVNKKTIEIEANNSSSKNGPKKTTTVTSSELWTALQDASKSIKLNEIGTLESPTNKRQFDGAMFGSLILTNEDSIYTSAGFDHGHPPLMIKTIVDSLVKLGMK